MQDPPQADAAQAAQWSAFKSKACSCSIGACAGWESVSDASWPSEQMKAVATFRPNDVSEPTYEEHHPQGTRYESPLAPVAINFFPYNRCDIHHCSLCERYLLRYTEFGGYYVDHRIRCLNGVPVTAS
jgi:hypothetical protein